MRNALLHANWLASTVTWVDNQWQTNLPSAARVKGSGKIVRLSVSAAQLHELGQDCQKCPVALNHLVDAVGRFLDDPTVDLVVETSMLEVGDQRLRTRSTL